MPSISERVQSSSATARDFGGGIDLSSGKSRLWRFMLPYMFRGNATINQISPSQLFVHCENETDARALAITQMQYILERIKMYYSFATVIGPSCHYYEWLQRSGVLDRLPSQAAGLKQFPVTALAINDWFSTSPNLNTNAIIHLLLGSNIAANKLWLSSFTFHRNLSSGAVGMSARVQTTASLMTAPISTYSNLSTQLMDVLEVTGTYTTTTDSRPYFMLIPANIGLNF